MADQGEVKVWGKRIGYGHNPVLLVVDLTRAFTEPPRPLASDATETIDATNKLVDAARGAGVPVMFTAVTYDTDDFSDAGLWGKKIGGQEDLRAGSDGVEIDPRLHRETTDAVLVKKYASCFFGTDLATRLTAMGCDTLVITGVSTSGCIRATTVDAIQSGFRPVVVREAVADRWQQAHDQALYDLEAKYADVRPLSEVIEYLGQRG